MLTFLTIGDLQLPQQVHQRAYHRPVHGAMTSVNQKTIETYHNKIVD